MATPPDRSTPGPHGGARPTKTEILLLNHHRDDLAGALECLQRQGYGVQETQSIIETHRVLAKSRPGLIILNPLVLQPGSIELELLEDLQRDGDPVPVIMLIDRLETAYAAARSPIAIRDFITKPFSNDELLHRIELKLLVCDRFLALQQRADELEGQVLIDFKTGLINDRHFKAIQSTEFKRAQRHQQPLSLLLVDVDEFKRVNDTTEYSFGDEVLTHVARCMKQTIRTTDYAARFGGDEFALLLPHTTPEEAVQTANRVRRAISEMLVENGRYTTQVTVSIGIGTFDGRSRSSIEELRRQANKALHEAKLHGKDQVWLHADSTGHLATDRS
jgi:diguanylate cyclase (GGDEF)-like protein